MVGRRQVMGNRPAAGTVLAGTLATVLAVFLSVGCAAAASSATVPLRAPAGKADHAPLGSVKIVKIPVRARPVSAPAPAARVGPAPLKDVRIPGRAVSAPEAIAAGGGRVWIANSLYPVTFNAGGWVTELSARNGALIRVISAGRDKLTDPEAIAVAGNRVWVVNSFGNTVTELDASTGALIRVIGAPRYQLNSGGYSVAIAARGNRVWVPNGNANSVTEINAATGALIRVISGPRYDFSSPVEVAVRGNLLWVVSSTNDNSSVTVINASTGALIRVIWSLPNFAFAITPGEGGVWLVTNVGVKGAGDSGPHGSVAELRANSGRVVRNITVAPFASSAPGGAIAADGTHVWMAGTYFYRSGGWVAELSALTGARIRVITG